MFRPMSRVVALILAVTAVAVVLAPVTAYAYEPNVTKKDIIDGGGFCITSSYCFINGKVWDCSGGGKCVLRFVPPPGSK